MSLCGDCVGTEWRVARRSVICPCKAAEVSQSVLGAVWQGSSKYSYWQIHSAVWMAVLDLIGHDSYLDNQTLSCV